MHGARRAFAGSADLDGWNILSVEHPRELVIDPHLALKEAVTVTREWPKAFTDLLDRLAARWNARNVFVSAMKWTGGFEPGLDGGRRAETSSRSDERLEQFHPLSVTATSKSATPSERARCLRWPREWPVLGEVCRCD